MVSRHITYSNIELTLHFGLYNKIQKQVKALAASRGSTQNDTACDINGIFSRVIGLFSSDREVDVKTVFAHELAPVPTSMFSEKGMRVCKEKSVLKKRMQLEMSKESITNANITVIDGSALLWTIRWPLDGTVEDFVNAFENRIASYLVNSDVYLIFDRYHEYSIKSAARESRMTDAFTMQLNCRHRKLFYHL